MISARFALGSLMPNSHLKMFVRTFIMTLLRLNDNFIVCISSMLIQLVNRKL